MLQNAFQILVKFREEGNVADHSHYYARDERFCNCSELSVISQGSHRHEMGEKPVFLIAMIAGHI